MKVVKSRLEIFVNMGIMCFCLRNSILKCKTWDDVVEVLYK